MEQLEQRWGNSWELGLDTDTTRLIQAFMGSDIEVGF